MPDCILRRIICLFLRDKIRSTIIELKSFQRCIIVAVYDAKCSLIKWHGINISSCQSVCGRTLAISKFDRISNELAKIVYVFLIVVCPVCISKVMMT